MSMQSGEQDTRDALMTLLRDDPILALYFKKPWQVTTNDADMNKGADYFAIFRPVDPAITPISPEIVEMGWKHNVEILVKWVKPEDIWSRLSTIRGLLISIVTSRQFLSTLAGVTKPGEIEEAEPEYIYLEGTPVPIFLSQKFVVTITQVTERIK